MKIKIGKTPYKVTLIGQFDSTLHRGSIDYNKREITLATRSGKPVRARSPRGIRHTFWHEAVHGMLYDMGSAKYHDELFVDELAKRVAQVCAQTRDTWIQEK